ncbi:hypothetical protein DPMN_156779 [Dreissena polymorpha]|uniref:Uncharacterized protein n=1 Tax=Dreissena polymorpha TaxID=45954 RepID=A0A9D4FPK7_DREPO|nr:hypothetical protein DPMN_156779 [Dreissena polymorpha]
MLPGFVTHESQLAGSRYLVPIKPVHVRRRALSSALRTSCGLGSVDAQRLCGCQIGADCTCMYFAIDCVDSSSFQVLSQ